MSKQTNAKVKIKATPSDLFPAVLPAYTPCKVVLSNQTPASWGATIEGALADFTYLDGSTSRDSRAPITVRAGDSVTLVSLPKCVVKAYWAINVRMDGKTYLFDDTGITPPGKCALYWEGGLKPAAAAPLKEFEEGISSPLELVRTA